MESQPILLIAQLCPKLFRFTLTFYRIKVERHGGWLLFLVMFNAYQKLKILYQTVRHSSRRLHFYKNLLVGLSVVVLLMALS